MLISDESNSSRTPSPTKFWLISYALAAAIFLSCLGLIVVKMLQTMPFEQLSTNSHNYDTIKSIEHWRTCYCVIGKLVEQLNRCFGLYLLLVITFYLIWCVSTAFYVLVTIRKKGFGDASVFLFLILQLVSVPLFIAIIYLPHQIKRQVCVMLILFHFTFVALKMLVISLKAKSLANRLRSIRSNNRLVRQKAHEMAVEVLLAPVHVTGLGMVNIDLSIVPTVRSFAFFCFVIL